MKYTKSTLALLLGSVALLLVGCSTTVEEDGQYYLCDQNDECRSDYECRLVNGDKACVPAEEAASFPSLDAGESDADVSDAGEDAVEDTLDDTDDAQDGVDPDTDEPDTGSGADCLDINVDSLEFGSIALDRNREKTVLIENCSIEGTASIVEATLEEDASGAFTLLADDVVDEISAGSLELEPGESVALTLRFEPTAEQNYSGMLLIGADVPLETFEVSLTGQGSTTTCVDADATAIGNGAPSASIRVAPTNTVTLDAISTYYSEGESIELAYEWTLTRHPTRSTARPTTPDQPATDLYLDTAGEYEAEVRAYEPGNTPACESFATVDISAVPTSDMYIELVWDTPADGDIRDGNGADLDIHYINQAGKWGEEPHDTFWMNPNPNWGDPNNDTDDPLLAVDDTDGAGPEVIEHDGLESIQYGVGAYYYAARGFGPSYASVYVWVNGSLAYSSTNKYLEEGAFWHVVDFTGPTPSTFDKRDTVTDGGFPEGD